MARRYTAEEAKDLLLAMEEQSGSQDSTVDQTSCSTFSPLWNTDLSQDGEHVFSDIHIPVAASEYVTVCTDNDSNSVEIETEETDDALKDPDFNDMNSSSSESENDEESANVNDETGERNKRSLETKTANKSRKRQRNEALWKRNVNKVKRARGQLYVNTKGKTIPAKNRTGPPCNCRMKCADKICPDDCDGLFKDFLDIGNKEQQDSFIFGLVYRRKIVRRRNEAQKTGEKRKEESYKYDLLLKNGQKLTVCKSAFMSVYGITAKRLRRLQGHLNQSVSTPPKDKRGKHEQHRKTPELLKDKIREHINSFPARESHYSRRDSSRKYLSEDLSVRRMWMMFVQKYQPEHYDEMMEGGDYSGSVKERTYRDIFNKEFNLNFGQPRSDTCSLCDSLKVEIDAASIP